MTPSGRPFTFYCGIAGIAGAICYFIANVLTLPPLVFLIFTITMSATFIIVCYAYRTVLRNNTWASIGFLCAVIALVVLGLMATLEATLRTDSLSLQESPDAHVVFKVFQTWFFGLKFLCDFFIALAMIFYCIALLQTRFIPSFVSYAGLLLGATMLFLNFITPWPRTVQGQVEMGPLLSIFMALVSYKLISIKRKSRTASIAKDTAFSRI